MVYLFLKEVAEVTDAGEVRPLHRWHVSDGIMMGSLLPSDHHCGAKFDERHEQ